MSETDEPPLREIIGTAQYEHWLECGHKVPFEQPKRAMRCASCGGDVWEDEIEDLGERIEIDEKPL
jgi:hypothetical protein